MKGIEILCASQAATAIRSMMDEGSSSSTIYLGRAIDRYNPIIRDSARTIPKTFPPCSSNNQPPISPQSRNNNQKDIITAAAAAATRKAGIKGSSSSSSSSSSKRNSFEQKRKKTSVINNKNNNNNGGPGDKKSSSVNGDSNNTKKKGGWGCTKPGDFISPPGSTRYLLSSDRASSFDALSSNIDPILNLPQSLKKQQQQQQQPSSSSSVQLPVPPPPSSSPSTPDQVVVLRVSLHCKGCERKMRKHISRMEGVTSFNIDFAAKKVTVIGDVTPLSVLASVSKVKNAQLLAPTISSSAPPVSAVP
ncbi:hypothetical protein LguiB_035222 [Lonicera macranthoides]